MIEDINKRAEASVFFIESVLAEVRHINKNSPTKKIVMDHLASWENTLETVKSILNGDR